MVDDFRDSKGRPSSIQVPTIYTDRLSHQRSPGVLIAQYSAESTAAADLSRRPSPRANLEVRLVKVEGESGER